MSVAAAAPAAPAGAAPFALDAVTLRLAGRDVLEGLSCAAPPGAIVALVGAAGAGKSSALRVALGLVRPTAGRALLFGRALAGAGRAERRALLRRVGVVWPGGALFPDLDVAGNVGFALRAIARRPREEVARAVHEGLLLVGLKHVEHLAVDELDRGVRRRVALARAVAHRPELLLLDEPAGGLDPVAAGIVRELVRQLRDRLGLTVVLATRDPAWALATAERVAVLRAGRVVADEAAGALTAAEVQRLLGGRERAPGEEG